MFKGDPAWFWNLRGLGLNHQGLTLRVLLDLCGFIKIILGVTPKGNPWHTLGSRKTQGDPALGNPKGLIAGSGGQNNPGNPKGNPGWVGSLGSKIILSASKAESTLNSERRI